MPMIEVEDENNIEVCDFCNSEEKNILKFGKVYKLENYLVHHFCLLFASALPQKGQDSEGVLGFLKEDLEKELVRGNKTQCNFCKKKGATIGCVQKKCKRSFHYKCSLENNGLFQFFDTFPAWCYEHRPVQSVFMQESPEEKAKRSCGICLELISGQTSQLWAPCCGGFFDSQCVSKLAATSGYFFKCPLCNNKDVFNIEMKKFGIHVPEQDADWENEPGAYSALHERYTHCDAEVCSCEDGRNYDEDDTIYEVILCQSCGSSGIHIQCGKLKLSDPVFLCNVCKGPEMVKEKEENESGRRKSLRGKPSEAEPTSAPRKLQLEKVMKSPSPSKNPRKNKCSLPNLEESIKSENASDDPIEIQEPVENNSKPKRGRRKLMTENVEEAPKNVIPELKTIKETVISELSSKPKRGRKKNVTEHPNESLENSRRKLLNSDTDLKEGGDKVKTNSKGKRRTDFTLLTDTRQPVIEFDNVVKQNGIEDGAGESSQNNAETKENSITNPVVIKIDPSIFDIVGPGSEDNSNKNEVKSEAREEELDTELFDLANQINFNFEIPSSPLRPITEATPSKLRTPIKNSPAKRLPKKNLMQEISSSPLKENLRGRLQTPQSTPIKEADAVRDITEKPSVTNSGVSNSIRRSGRKSEQVHETKQIPKCALNLNKACISEVQDAKANNKDQELLDKETDLNLKSIDGNIQNPSAKLNSVINAKTALKKESVIKEIEPHNGESSRSTRGSRKRDCASAGQSQKGYLPKPCKEKDTIKIQNSPQKPLIIKLGVKNTQLAPNGSNCRGQVEVSTNPALKLSEAELRKNRLEHAKIRVKINELMDELDCALASKDYVNAEVVKTKLDELKATQKHLEDEANCVSPELKAQPNLVQSSDTEIPKEKLNIDTQPIANAVGGKRKRTDITNDPAATAEPIVQQERTSKRLRTTEQISVPISISNQKENNRIEETEEKVTVTVTESKQSPRKTRTKGSLRTTPQKKGTDAILIENNQSDSELNHSVQTNDRDLEIIKEKEKNENVKTLISDWHISNEENEEDIHSNPQNLNEKAHSLESKRESNKKVSEPKSQLTSSETSQVPDLSRRSPRKPANITLNPEKNKEEATSMSSQTLSPINKSFPELENIRLQNFCINLFNINSNQLLKSVHEKRSNRIVVHLNKYLINKSGKPHSKQKLLKRKLDNSIGKMSEDLTSMKEEISKIIAQDKLRQNTKIILHLNLKAKTVTIKKIEKDQQKDFRRSGRSRTEEKKKATEVKTQAPQPKAKKDVSKTKSKKIMSKPVPKTKSTSRTGKETNSGTAPYPYATETTLEEELFYQICPLKPTLQPKGVRNQSSGRIGEKKNNTRRILISMQKIGRSPILDRPLSFVAFTFDGSNLISHETVDELKERTHNIKRPNIKKYSDYNDTKLKNNTKRFDNNDTKIKNKSSINKSVKISKVQNSVRKNKISIWKSSKFNSRIKTMISKNGTIQMTVNKEITSEVPNGLNVSKYFKIRRTSSFSPASHKSTSPTSRNETLVETQKEETLEMKKPVVPKIVSEKNNPMSTTLEEESVISPMKIKIPKDLWVKAKKDKRLLKLEKKQASVKQRSNASPKTVKVKYKNLYGRVIEYAKNLPRKN